MRSDVDVIILVVRVNPVRGLSDRNNSNGWNNCDNRSSWNNCDFNGDRFDRSDRFNDPVVESSSDRKIPRGTDAAEAIERLLNRGYKLLSANSLDNNVGRIVYTFARRDHGYRSDVQAAGEDFNEDYR